MSANHSSPRSALFRFGFKQSLKGALIVGLLAGIMAGGQGYAYTASYPDDASRTQFKAAIEMAPALGIIYGEADNLPSPAGYMMYRTAMFLTVVASIWGLMTAIRLLRGQEEDGRWEMILAGNTTPKQASSQVFLGFLAALFLAFALSVAGVTAFGAAPDVNAPSTAGLYLSLAIFVPAAMFGSLGFFVSQLAVTKRRALFYGLIPLLVLFAVRAVGNTDPDLRWLKMFSPFGWTELTMPTTTPHMVWLLPAVGLFGAFFTLGVYLVGKRDLGGSILRESSTVRSHFLLLGSPLKFGLRQSGVLFVGWGIGALFLSGLMAVISGIAATAVADSDSIKASLAQLGGSENLAVAFIGAGFILIAIVLQLMAAGGLAALRGGEAKNQLDNLLVQPVRRSWWLSGRLSIIIAAAAAVSLISAVATWAMAGAQDISLELGNLLLVSIALMGTVVFALGLGTLLYGLVPRVAAAGMYVMIAWSFLVEMIGSVVDLNDLLTKSSLLHYVSVTPTDTPDWKTFAWLCGLGVAMAALGVITFSKRDIITE